MNFTKIIIIGVISLVFVACSKDENKLVEQDITSQIDESTIIDNNIYPLISVKNAVLCFKSMEYYNSILEHESGTIKVEELTKYLNTTSFKSYGKKLNEKSEYNESFMDAIMNEDKIIKIGEWFIYIDLPSETVLAISENEKNAYSSLLNNSNSNIKKFSVGDDVLDHLINNTSAQTEGCGGIGGGVYPSYTYYYQGKVIKTFTSGIVWRLYPYVKFFRAGIYFNLSSNYEVWKFNSPNATTGGEFLNSLQYGGGIKIEMFIRYAKAWWRKRPCKSSSVGTHPYGFHYSNWASHYSKSVYVGTRNLNGYYFYVQGRAKYSDGTYTGATPYGGRNINSPY